MKFIHKLLNHWPRCNEMINTFIRILSKALSSLPLKSDINTCEDTIKYINKLINYIKPPQVDVLDSLSSFYTSSLFQYELCYTSFKVFECNWIWELFINYESVYENQISELMKYTKLHYEQTNNYDIKIISENVLSLMERYRLRERNVSKCRYENNCNSNNNNDNAEWNDDI